MPSAIFSICGPGNQAASLEQLDDKRSRRPVEAEQPSDSNLIELPGAPEDPQHAELGRRDVETGAFLDEDGLRNLVRAPDQKSRPVAKTFQRVDVTRLLFLPHGHPERD